MSNYDKDGVPKGATHYGDNGQFYRLTHTTNKGPQLHIWMVNGAYWETDNMDSVDHIYSYPRATELPWMGQGLPPVGTVVNCDTGMGTTYCGTVEVLHYGTSRVFLRSVDGTDTEFTVLLSKITFSPVKTSDQLELEKRAACVAIAKAIILKNATSWHADGIETLYDAGMLRMPDQSQSDAGIVDMYRHLQKVTPYRFKKIQDASITDGGDVMYFHKDRFDAALLADMATLLGGST